MSDKKERLFSTVIFVFTVAWFSVFAFMRIDPHHDAIMLKPAIDLASGRVLFRDTFCQYGALAVFLQAAAVKLFGGDIVVIRLLTVLFYGGCAVLADRIFRRFLSFPFRLVNLGMFWGLAPFYLVPMHPWSSVYALFFMLLSVEFLLQFMDREKIWMAWCAGGFAGCAFLARHPCGAVIFAAGVVVLLLRSGYLKKSCREWMIYSTGFLLPPVILAVYLTLTGAWRDYLAQCFSFVFNFVVTRGGQMQWQELTTRMFPLNETLWLIDTIYSILPLLCAGVLLLAFHRLSHGSGEEKCHALELMAVALAALGSWHQYYPVPCIRHLFWAAVPMFGIFALVLEKLWYGVNHRKRQRLVALLLIAVAVIPIGVRLYGAYKLFAVMSQRTTLNMPGVRGMLLSPAEFGVLDSLRRVWSELPPEVRARGLFNYSPDAIFSVVLPETGFRNPMFVNWGDTVYPDYPEKAQAYISRVHPPILCRDDPLPPGYLQIWTDGLYGVRYRLYAPLN